MFSTSSSLALLRIVLTQVRVRLTPRLNRRQQKLFKGPWTLLETSQGSLVWRNSFIHLTTSRPEEHPSNLAKDIEQMKEEADIANVVSDLQ